MKTDLLKKIKKGAEVFAGERHRRGRGEVKLHVGLSERPPFTGEFGMADHPICFWLAD